MSFPDRKLKILIAYNEPQQQAKHGDLDYISEAAVKDEAELVHQVILKLGHIPTYLPIKNLDDVFQMASGYEPDLIFNLCEGFHGNAKHEMFLAGLWELLKLPYTGNPPMSLGMAQNKVLAKYLFQANNIPTPRFEVFDCLPKAVALEYPLIAKPSQEDASLGITPQSVINTFEELQAKVDELLKKYRQPILVEQFIQGREFNISILGNNPPKALPISEISFSALGDDAPHITSYEAKWLPDHPLYQKTPSVCPAQLSDELKRRLETVALQVYHLLMGRDYGRVDTRVDSDGNIFVLEYNPNPDISAEAGYVKALKAAGIKYQEFVELLIHEALNRELNVSN